MKILSAPQRRGNPAIPPHPRVLRCVRQILFAGVALVVVWPAARGYSHWIGWLPLWLLGMPVAAWWSLYRFRLPAFLRISRHARSLRQPRRGDQARRIRKPAGGRAQVA